MTQDVFSFDDFADRHIGPRGNDITHMLDVVGRSSLEELLEKTVPAVIRWHDALDLPAPLTEADALAELADIASSNRRTAPMIGLGYRDCITPPVIKRNVLESPAWYTAYTPYQPEISQGRLEALINFQTVVEDLTGLPIAGSSLLDEPTAAAEAMTLARRSATSKSNVFVVDADTLPQTLAVLATRANPLGIELDVRPLNTADDLPSEAYGVLLSYPGASGHVKDIAPLIAAAKSAGMVTAVATDLLALTLLTPPGEMGADVVVGSAQRFGVPLGFGGPHAGYMSVRAGLERSMPGRLVGVSVDAQGRPAYRLALQTREQHIRREKATSNICTAQVLLAVIASMYAAWHGPAGLTKIATRTHAYAAALAAGAQAMGIPVVHDHFFDTVQLRVPGKAHLVQSAALSYDISIYAVDADVISISTDETTTDGHIASLFLAFHDAGFGAPASLDEAKAVTTALPSTLARTSPFMSHPVFHAHRSETQMLRYLRSLSDKDIALDRAMIPLGSCTMKLNSTSEMEPITWADFANIHPFAPIEHVSGYLTMIRQLEQWLVEVTGYAAISLQPNAGSQGEFAGLLAIREYLKAKGEGHRDLCLIPSSAHGTNAASAVMAGMRVIVVACDDAGNVDINDLKAKIAANADTLAALMITYPSTHGVFETAVADICAMVHDAGGQVYVDGANLNALVGLAKPGKFGADVSHLNLHKTFCIPHGGGGPGIGPVAVGAHLAPFLPSHPLRPEAGPLGRGHHDGGVGPVSGAPWGSAGILPIPWVYLRTMGADGLRRATSMAILNANYIATRLNDYFPVLYTGENGHVAHECILDLREITKATGVTVDDVAKRLIDYGFHAPTMSFPVAGTLMVEPTESESLDEIDRFIEAMIAIKGEIDKVAAGEWPREDNPLCNAPHTMESIVGDWSHPYSREVAAYPVASLRQNKYFAPVARIDGAYGDRNLVCSCPSPEAFANA